MGVHLVAKLREVGLQIAATGAATSAGTAGTAAALPVAAVRPAAACFFARQVLQFNLQIVLSRQTAHQRTEIALAPANVINHRPSAVEQNLDIEQFDWQLHLGCCPPAVCENLLAALVHSLGRLLILARGKAKQLADAGIWKVACVAWSSGAEDCSKFQTARRANHGAIAAPADQRLDRIKTAKVAGASIAQKVVVDGKHYLG